jgi:hypothetical protein
MGNEKCFQRSKVLFFNITQKFTNLVVQLSIFLIDLFVGTYRLSSHARLEAFVIQSKLNLSHSTWLTLLFFSNLDRCGYRIFSKLPLRCPLGIFRDVTLPYLSNVPP